MFRFMLDLNKEQVDMFGQKMMEFAKEGGLEVLRGGIGRREAHFVYKHAQAKRREE